MTTANTLQPQEKTKEQQIANFLNKPGVIKQIQTMSSIITPEKLANLTLNEIRKNPKLAECTTTSLLGGILQCAALGLDPDSSKKQVYLIPYENREKSTKVGKEWEQGKLIDIQLQVQVSFIGMQTLINRNPDVQKITSRVVYASDEFECEYGLDETLRHKPSMQANQGSMTHAYAVVHMKDGSKIFEVMSRDQINQVATTSKTVKRIKEDGSLDATYGTPWHSHYEEMARKTVFRRLFKWIPQVDGLIEAASIEDQADHSSMWNPDVIDGESQRTKPSKTLTSQKQATEVKAALPSVNEQMSALAQTIPASDLVKAEVQHVDTQTGEVLYNTGPLSEPDQYPVNPDDDDIFAGTGV